MVFAAPSYLERFGTPSTPEDLAHHRCIVGLRGEGLPSWVLSDAAGRACRFTPPPTHEIGDSDAVVEAAIAGLGIAQMPASLVRDAISQGRLLPVLDEFSQTVVSIHAVWPGSRHLLPKVRLVVDELVRKATAGALD